MLYAIKIATRYLTASKAQTALLVLGVALGVFIFIFMSALIGGLSNYILRTIAGDLSHVTIIAEVVDPELLSDPGAGIVLLAQEKASLRQATLNDTAAFVPMIAALPGVVAVSPQINGTGFLTRGGQAVQVAITGVEPGLESAIIRLDRYLIAGTTHLGSGQVMIGKTLAEDLGLSIADSIRLDSAQGINAVLTVSGIYELGQGGIDSASAYVSLNTARTLFALPRGVTRIEIKLADLMAADAIAARITAVTGMAAESWTTPGAEVLSALKAQDQTGVLLKSFAMVSIIIGIASSLMLSTYRRRAEIGIMRAMGASRRFVVFVFVSQGALVGVIGGVTGAGLGYLVLSAFPARDSANPSVMPVDITEGAFGVAILLTIIIAVLAAILPARAAARVDPVTAIGQ